ncbi:isochorismatase family cysteine hydrolase [Pseudosulfitobacter sp. DSM 107133]|uniref:cysteine hydrolase family protein n=1 Tax=Pseudosulfitobacter sp. DSM 107133 TaxID=2883100 RepID=UPI001FAE6F97|nr:isochorismatase family cysteine hydrolase [Pseudosulfitobacter sp. DSM 107133]
MRIGAISRGTPIGARQGTALLLIDLQSVFWDHGPYAEPAKAAVGAAILDEIRAAKSNGFPVIALRQEWSIPSTVAVARLLMKGQAVKGSDGTEIAAPFAEIADYSLVKRVQDAFETGELDVLLERLGVERLRIVGLDFNYCVLKTALAARHRGFAVTVVKDGTLAAKPTEDAEKRMLSGGVLLH